jgi:hypothetical protein
MALQGGLTYQNPAGVDEMWWLFELRTTANGSRMRSPRRCCRGASGCRSTRRTRSPLMPMSDENDEQLSQVAKASPAQQPGRLSAVTG